MIISRILYAAAVCCMIYFVMVAIYTGLASSFHFIWIFIAAVLIFVGILMAKQHAGTIAVPLWIRIIFAGMCIAAGCVFTWAEALIISGGHRAPDSGAKYVIVLGAQIRGTEISRPLAYRLDAAFEYLENNPEAVAILSGGQGSGEDISEAEAMKSYLLDRGISDDRILTEDQSVNTEENIAFSMEWMDDPQDSVVIVSNAFHIYRALQICEKRGLSNVQGLGAPSNRIMVPSYYLREAMAVVKYKLSGQI